MDNIIKKGCIERAHVKPYQRETLPTDPVARLDDTELVKRLNLKSVQSKSRDAVPMDKLQHVAARHAAAIWGEDVSIGDPLPLLDSEDEPVAYAFPCAIGMSEIPETCKLIKQISQLRRAADPSKKAGRSGSTSLPLALRNEITRYVTIYVSAKKSDYPVTRIKHSLHPYFYRGEQALEVLGADEAKLIGLRYLPPFEFFEMKTRGEVTRLHADTLINESDIRKAAPASSSRREATPPDRKADSARKERIEAVWKAYEKALPVDKPLPPPPWPGPEPLIQFLIRYWERMPAINWTQWCEPTAACMVFAFWDHYVPVPGIGTHVGYERIVDYWYDHESNDNNVPDIMDPIANDINVDVANIQKGYNWTVSKVIGNAGNDWAWNEIVAHLHNHRPFVWQIHAGTFHHAVAAFGYSLVLGQKYVIHFNTWSADPALAREEWLYNEYAGTPINSVEVDRYVPGGKELYRAMFLYRPYGEESYHVNQWNEIRFYVHPQSDIAIAQIEYSLDGGRTWHLVLELWTQPNWNSWWWKPTQTSSKARVRVRGLSQNRDYLAGSGSFKNFTIA